ncbi:HesA/MoeB/ThiF family protein [Nonomuraea endophytica]|uniref:Bacteriocin biosynthesis cyclodehydratase domain-containing protein n=1 Tax=Nonomuraea endophytica TaxID=714136 RepID=A0A7W7ZZ42_9ACTN|nr:ThiF family adenylyltransferase [Nonomuraea endophytica]MBB5076492.1 bacteriocin biosynthesis cyclodehydratase domain-containing protein [Nonomuraea endophytica]
MQVAAARLREHAPDVKVTEVERRITGAGDLVDVVPGADLVVNTVDRPQLRIRRWVNRACVKARVPFILGGFTQHVALVGPLVVPGVTGCLACQGRDFAGRYGSAVLPSPANSERLTPSFGPLCGTVSGLVAGEAIRYLTGTGTCAALGATIRLDLLDLTTATSPFERREDCWVCDARPLLP